MNLYDMDGDLLGKPRYLLTQIQLFNWGTFNGLHRIPIARHGHFLTGPSGAGKSTILDAHSVLMTPPAQIDFNAASRDGGKKKSQDRSFISYLRGTWGSKSDEDSGDLAKQHNRPGPTWSAIAEVFETEDGHVATMIHISWIKNSGMSAKDRESTYAFAERMVDLRDLQPFADNGLSLRYLQKALPDVKFVDFREFQEKFRIRFGINSELALKLLHKTQSAKNLDDLDEFLRNYMLDKPGTFDVANDLVNEFNNLNNAYQAVVTARRQVQILTPAREANARRFTYSNQKTQVDALAVGLLVYVKNRQRDLLRDEVARLRAKVEGLSAQVEEEERKLHIEEGVARDLDLEALRIPGAQMLEQLKNEHIAMQAKLKQREGKLAQAELMYSRLDLDIPGNLEMFEMQKSFIRQELEKSTRVDEHKEKERNDLAAAKASADVRVNELMQEVRAMEQQRSSIPSPMLAIRSRIAQGVGVSPSELPFVGELLEVKQSEIKWRGALERVLRGFSLSMLVDGADKDLCRRVREYVNDNHLGGRIVYHQTKDNDRGFAARPKDVVNKVNIQDGKWEQWIRNEMIAAFDYQCVDSVAQLDQVDRGVTKEGQVKHTKTRFEKNDRFDVNDRREWVTGFDNASKREYFGELVSEANEQAQELQKKLDNFVQAQKEARERIVPLTFADQLQWDEVDVDGAKAVLKDLTKRIQELEENNKALNDVNERKAKQVTVIQALKARIDELKNTKNSSNDNLLRNQKILTELEVDPTVTPVGEFLDTHLGARFARMGKEITHENIRDLGKDLDVELKGESNDLALKIKDEEMQMFKSFQQFVMEFPSEAVDLQPTIEFEKDFMAKLERLEHDNLPKFLKDFERLLDGQSYQHLVSLRARITDAQAEIRERLDIVNDSLAGATFNSDGGRKTTIKIVQKTRNLPEVQEFFGDVRQALENSMSDATKEDAEHRFLAIQKIVKRFASDTAEDIRWRNNVLDVREHVEFIGQELDENGKEVESYSKDSGKSGGQKQKLAVTCLAAALRYQLGGSSEQFPSYCTVVLDEAFMRSDRTFTEQCINVFQSFGFQLVIATPLQRVMAIEPFVRGASFITIKDRKDSRSKDIHYDVDTRRLELLPEMTTAVAKAEKEAIKF